MNNVIPAHSSSQSFQEILMGQASKGFPKKSTGGRLRCRGEELYKEMTTIKTGHVIWEEKKKTYIPEKVWLIKEHSILGLDRWVIFLPICTFDHVDLDPIHWGLHLICLVVSLWDLFSNKFIVLGLLGWHPLFLVGWSSNSSPYNFIDSLLILNKYSFEIYIYIYIYIWVWFKLHLV